MNSKNFSESEIRILRLGYFKSHLFFVLANILAVLANTFLNQFLIDIKYQELVRIGQSDIVILFFSNILPFPLVFFSLLIRHRPLLRCLNPGLFDTKALKLSANLPLEFSIAGALGWIFGTIIFQILFAIRMNNYDANRILTSSLLTLCTAAIVFVLTYHMLEYFQRKKIIQKVFRENEFNNIQGAMKPSLILRFSIYILAASLIPGFITVRLLQILNNDGKNVFGRDLSIDFLILFLIITISVISITILLVNSVREPLKKMRLQANRIESDDFSIRTLVDTRDEIGDLSAALNSMTTARAEKEFIKDTFGKIVDPAIRDHLLKGNVNLGGTSGEATILFSDLAGFTGMSEQHTPEEVVSILNEYFKAMSACISANGGIINKFIGDAILAVFGLPAVIESPADSALKTAVDMQKAGQTLNQKLAEKGYAPLKTRIGIHHGTVIAGNIGSDSRMEYTVIGDTVNTASRLESACKKLNVHILISDAAKEKLKQTYNIESAGLLRLKGKNTAVRAWTLRE